jgi:microcystin-dependent protein
MTAALKLISGNSSVPALTFAAEPTLGFYRSSSGIVGLAGSLDVSGGVTIDGNAILPVGVILPYGGSTAPAAWLLCDGSAKSRTTYASLFAAIGTSYGVGDGSTTFNVPDLRGRVPAGKDNMGGTGLGLLTSITMTPDGSTLGATGGAQTETLSLSQLPTGITSANAGTIALSVTTTPKVVNGPNQGSAAGGGTQVTASDPGSGGALSQVASTGTIGIGVAAVTSNNTSGAAHINVQPTLITLYIIYAGV